LPPLERAARAFAKAYLIESQSWYEGDPYVADWVNAHWKDFLPHARNVLAAVRELDPVLIAKLKDEGSCGAAIKGIKATHAATIDAMLEDVA